MSVVKDVCFCFVIVLFVLVLQILLMSASMLFSSDNKDVWDVVQQVRGEYDNILLFPRLLN